MTKDNSTGKNKEFYDLGKKMFDRLNPHIAHKPKVVGPKQEPAGRFAKFTDGIWREVTEGSAGVPLYTTPPQRTWVGLTQEEIYSVLENLQVMYNRPPTTDSRIIFARAIEAKLKEKNT
jgi:hypothetical protein